MRKTKNHSKFVWQAGLVLFVLLCAYPISFLFAANNPYEFIKATTEPAVLSKTEIISNEVFNATIKSKGVSIKDSSSLAARLTYRFTANNKASGETQVLNSAFSVTIEPFPQKVGQTYETSDNVPLQFSTETKVGEYMIISELTKVEMKDPQLGWQEATVPTKPAAPTQPTAPTEPTAPTKPTDSTGGDGTKPIEPTAPTEPTQPIEPTQPTEPTLPSKFQEIGVVKYSLEKITFTPSVTTTDTIDIINLPSTSGNTLKSPIIPKPPTPFCSATCTTSQICPPNTTKLTNKTCPAIQESYRCGFFWLRTCYKSIPQYCCAPVVTVIRVSTLSVSKYSVIGGDGSVGTVTLSGPAPSGGQVVQLSADPSDSVIIPLTMTVAAGATSGTFDIKTKKVNSIVNVNITGKINNSQKTTLLVVNPIPDIILSKLKISPFSVTSGLTTVGTVTLSGPASAGGQVVKLSSSAEAPISIPTDVTVNEGATTATFTITAKWVSSPTYTLITATLYKSKQIAGLTVNPLAISTFAVSPNLVINEETAIGTITLNGPAPSGGQIVQLSAIANDAFSIPKNMTVAAGATSGTFEIKTKKVTSSVKVNIKVRLNKSEMSAQFTINPSITVQISASPRSVINGESAIITLTLSSPAPAGGQVVQLLAHENTSFIFPEGMMTGHTPQFLGTIRSGTLLIKAGEISTSFTVKTKMVTTSGLHLIWAFISTNDIRSVTSVVINQTPVFTLMSLLVSPNSLMSGTSSVGTLSFNMPAPVGGKVVQLSAEPGRFITIPASIPIAAGATSGTFEIKTKTVPSSVTENITASLNNWQRKASLTITPAPVPCSDTCRPTKRQGDLWGGSWVTKCQDNETEVQAVCPNTDVSYSCFAGLHTCRGFNLPAVCCKAK